jgi:signal transduction histidine kinase
MASESLGLANAAMNLTELRASTTASSGLPDAVNEIIKVIDGTIQDTRALISELGSPILYELGFVPAIEWLTQQARKRHGTLLKCEVIFSRALRQRERRA